MNNNIIGYLVTTLATALGLLIVDLAVPGSVVGGLTGKSTAEQINPTFDFEDNHWRETYNSRPYFEGGTCRNFPSIIIAMGSSFLWSSLTLYFVVNQINPIISFRIILA